MNHWHNDVLVPAHDICCITCICVWCVRNQNKSLYIYWRVHVTVGCPSIRLSVPSIDSPQPRKQQLLSSAPETGLRRYYAVARETRATHDVLLLCWRLYELCRLSYVVSYCVISFSLFCVICSQMSSMLQRYVSLLSRYPGLFFPAVKHRSTVFSVRYLQALHEIILLRSINDSSKVD